MNKTELERKKSLARTLYMAGKEQAEIAEQVEISRQTISKWVNSEGWKEQRAAISVTRPELVNKLLLTIDTLITQVNSSEDPQLIAGLGDRLAKLSAVIEKLDKKANVVDAIEVFMAFLTSSLRTPKIFIKEFGDFLMSCHQHCLGVNLLVQR